MIMDFALVEKELIINIIKKNGELVGKGDHYMLERIKQNVVRFYMVFVWEDLETVMMFDFIC